MEEIQSGEWGKIAGVLLLVVLGVGAYLLFPQFRATAPAPAEGVTKDFDDAIRQGVAPRPALTAAVKEKVAKSKGFSALVSYSGSGFEPNTATIKKGEAIRFTNNSSGNLSIALYNKPASEIIAPQDFVEITFDETGEWRYGNAADPAKSGRVVVE